MLFENFTHFEFTDILHLQTCFQFLSFDFTPKVFRIANYNSCYFSIVAGLSFYCLLEYVKLLMRYYLELVCFLNRMSYPASYCFGCLLTRIVQRLCRL
jgi:hypothetical protein